jgi:hypothetical protein
MKIHIGWMVAAVVVLAGMGMQQGESTEKWEYEAVEFTQITLHDGLDYKVRCRWPGCYIEAIYIGRDLDTGKPEYSLVVKLEYATRFCQAYNVKRAASKLIREVELGPELDAMEMERGDMTGGDSLLSPAIHSQEIVLDLLGQDGWQVFQVDTEIDTVSARTIYNYEYHLRRRIN